MLSMRAGNPQTALEAVTWRRLLVSRWPWRSARYLLTTVPVAVVAAVGLAIPSVPWLMLTAGGHQPGMIVVLILLGAALIVLLGPVVAVPLAELERRRLRMVDARPVGSGHRKGPAGGLASRARARYAESATWREVGYACLLATVVPVLSIAALLAAPLVVSFIASPFLVLAQRPGSAPVALAVGKVATVEQTLPYVIAGVVLLPVVPYLLTLLAGAHAAVARALLQGDPGEQLRAELVEVSRSRARLADTFEAERRRIERDLHDGAQQRLVSLTLQLGLARLDLPPDSAAAETVAIAHEQAKQLMTELRELIHGIQPQVLSDLGLPAALSELTDQCPLPVTLSAALAGRLPSQIENTAYFVVAEALTNIAKHSGATSASVTAHHDDGVLAVEISDNGHGGADPRCGTGLTGLADRVAVTGGRMLLSSPPGGPTLLRVELPCTQSRPPSG
jgi:signal transduction histidine kinase